jgi:hypothetical protein
MDPIADPSQQTVRFQDPPVNRPPQSLIGQTFLGSSGRSSMNTPYVVQDATVQDTSHWAYAGSGFVNGAQVPSIVGYEVDQYSCQYGLPANRNYSVLARSKFRDSDGYTAFANASMYQAPSGAWVFDAGTMSWSWALDRTGYVDARLQKTTANILDGLAGVTTPAPPASSNIPDCSEHRNLTFEGGTLTSEPAPGATGGDKTFGTVVLDTTTPLAGTTSMKVPTAPNSYLDTRLTPTDDTDVSIKLMLRSLPTSDIRVVMMTSLAATYGNLVVRPSGVVCLRSGNGWIGGSPTNSCTSTPLALNTIYKLRIHQVRGTGNDGVLEGYVAPVADPFGAPFLKTTTGDWTTKIDRIAVGTTTGAAVDGLFDDIKIDGVPLTRPSAPTDLVATPSMAASRVDLRWTDTSSNESSMVVERDTNSAFSSPAKFTLPAGTTSYTDNSAADGTQYWYRVRAVNAAAPSNPSNVAAVTTRPVPPAAPTGLTGTIVSQSRTQLSWTDNSSNETGFELDRANNAAFAGATTFALPANTTSYDDAGLAEGVYYYRVRATNGVSSSAYTSAFRGPRIKDITFEDGTPSLVDATTGVSANAVGVQETASPILGRYSARIPGVANGYMVQNVSGSDQLYLSMYFRMNVMPTSDNRILQVMNGSVAVANAWVRTNGTLCLKYGTAWSGGSLSTACTPTTSPLRAGTAYRLVIRQRAGTATSNAIVEGSWATYDPVLGTGALTQFTSSSVPSTDAAYWTTQPSSIRIGATLSTNALDAVFDDIKLDTTYTPGPSLP